MPMDRRILCEGLIHDELRNEEMNDPLIRLLRRVSWEGFAFSMCIFAVAMNVGMHEKLGLTWPHVGITLPSCNDDIFLFLENFLGSIPHIP